MRRLVLLALSALIAAPASSAPDCARATLPAQGGLWPWVATFPAAAAQSKTLILPFDAENQRWTVPSGAALP